MIEGASPEKFKSILFNAFAFKRHIFYRPASLLTHVPLLEPMLMPVGNHPRLPRKPREKVDEGRILRPTLGCCNLRRHLNDF